MNVAMYLRKSRADLEAEQIGEFETLAKHKAVLLDVAKKKNLNIVDIKEEIVSGDSIINRPQMIKLLQEVEDNKYDAVLVMDIDRLGRGGMKDQGLILETFKFSNTKIITPQKIYDLDDDLDEQMTEMQTFIARQELKMIKKRLTRGQLKSFRDGNYVFGDPPFGYKNQYDSAGKRHLVQDVNAETVYLIYDLYVNQNLGVYKIARYLDSLGVKPAKSDSWHPTSVTSILKNKAYCGYFSRGRVKQTRKLNENGNYIFEKQEEDKVEYIKANIKPIISVEMFERAQAIRSGKLKHRGKWPIKNPFSGLVVCGKCGASMNYNTKDVGIYLRCNKTCGNRQVRFEVFEDIVIGALQDTLDSYKIQVDKIDYEEKDVSKESKDLFIINKFETELKELEQQKIKLYDLLERGIYDDDVFLERSENLKNRITNIKVKLKELEKVNIYESPKKTEKEIIDGLKNVIDLYPAITNIEKKNSLLKTVIKKIFCIKEPNTKKDDFKIEIELNLDIN
jgi:site-specific DNA recombinase